MAWRRGRAGSDAGSPVRRPGAADVQRLLDDAAIRAVVGAYAVAVDRRDWDAVRACYHPGARDRRRGDDRGVAELVAWLVEAVGVVEAMSHHITTHVVRVDGETAASEALCLARHRLARVDRLIVCRYRDRFERRARGWRIAERDVDYDPPLEVARADHD